MDRNSDILQKIKDGTLTVLSLRMMPPWLSGACKCSITTTTPGPADHRQ